MAALDDEVDLVKGVVRRPDPTAGIRLEPWPRWVYRLPAETRVELDIVARRGHQPGTVDSSLRPNQIFAVGGLPLALVDGPRARSIVDTVERELLTPVGLRSLAASDPAYRPHYGGGPGERDSAYHQGTVWPWLIGAFVEAWVRVRGGRAEARRHRCGRAGRRGPAG